MIKNIIGICLLFLCSNLYAANYTLEIVRPETSIGSADRIYKAYPGITYTTETVVFGGTYPFTFSLSNAPSGMTIDEDTGTITWVNPQSSASNIQVSVEDADSNSDSATWSITVGTSGFYFVDADAGGGGDGSLSTPWNDIDDFYLGSSDTTYQNAIIYFYTGTYHLPQSLNNGTEHSCYRIDFNSGHPVALIAYPGETPTIDHDRYGDPCMFYVTRDNFYLDGLILDEGYSHFILVPTGTHVDYLATFNTTFRDMGGSGDNIAAITYYGDGPIQYTAPSGDSGFSLYPANQYCTFYNINATGIGAVTDYGTKYLVFHGNTVEDVPVYGGIILKSTNTHTMIRACTFDNAANAVRIMAQYYASNLDISFNNFIDCNVQIGQYTGDHGPENVYYYRNTNDGLVRLEYIQSDDGPVYFTDNVIVNSSPADHIQDEIGEHASITANVSVLSGNLTGVPADGIIDSVGQLQGSYRTTYLGLKGYELDDSGSTPPTFSSASVNDTAFTLNFSETVVTTGYDSGDCVVTGTSSGAHNITSFSGTGSSRTATLASGIEYGETTTLSCTLGTDDIEDVSGNDMVTFGPESVTNNTPEAAPTVTAFVVPSTSSSLTVAISTFTATDDTGVTGYCVNESATPPTSGSCSGSGWEVSAQTSYTFSSEGTKTLYAWAKDAANNISDSLNDSVAISLQSGNNASPNGVTFGGP